MLSNASLKYLQGILCFCILLSVPLLLPAHAEEKEIGLNSRWNISEHLVLHNEEVYCLASKRDLSTTVYRITAGQTQRVYHTPMIRSLCSHAKGIVLVKDAWTLDDFVAKLLSANVFGDVSVRLLDTETLSTVEWERYSTSFGKMTMRPFTYEGEIYAVVNADENGYLLNKYVAPYVSRTLLRCPSRPYLYPTFILTNAEPSYLYRNKAYVTIYDIGQKQQYETKKAIFFPNLAANQGQLQAVLKADDLFYLSQDALCRYSFSEQKSYEVFAYNSKNDPPSDFTLTSQYAICYSGDYTIQVYDLKTGQCIKQMQSSVAAVCYLYYDKALYLFDPYKPDAVEVIDFDSFEQTRYELHI